MEERGNRQFGGIACSSRETWKGQFYFECGV